MRVLVVGDKSQERRIVCEVLAELGQEAVEAEDGKAGWEAYQAGQFDIVISDYVMPGLNGLELCQAIRGLPREHYTYILVCSLFFEKQHILAGFEAGVDDYVEKPLDPDELRIRLISAQRVTEIHRQLAHRNRELAQMSEDLLAQSRRDALTGVGNRLRFQDELPRLFDEHRRYGHRFCLGMCDIDNFKLYTDTYGHVAGDAVLTQVAQALNSNIRSSDSLFRMGGEEFLVILADQTEEGALIAAERLCRQVEALDIPHKKNLPHGRVTLTIGITPLTAIDEAGIDIDLQRADGYLYEGKAAGRNRVVSASTPRLSNSSS